jgi:hypothetical protein
MTIGEVSTPVAPSNVADAGGAMGTYELAITGHLIAVLFYRNHLP